MKSFNLTCHFICSQSPNIICALLLRLCKFVNNFIIVTDADICLMELIIYVQKQWRKIFQYNRRRRILQFIINASNDSTHSTEEVFYMRFCKVKVLFNRRKGFCFLIMFDNGPYCIHMGHITVLELFNGFNFRLVLIVIARRK